MRGQHVDFNRSINLGGTHNTNSFPLLLREREKSGDEAVTIKLSTTRSLILPIHPKMTATLCMLLTLPLSDGRDLRSQPHVVTLNTSQSNPVSLPNEQSHSKSRIEIGKLFQYKDGAYGSRFPRHTYIFALSLLHLKN